MIIDEQNNNIFIVEKLSDLKNKLDKDTLNLKDIKQDILQINNYNNAQNYEYLNSLLKPEKNKCTKVPTKIPIPSCTFQIRNSLNFAPYGSGLDVFAINPWFLASQAMYSIVISIAGTDYRIFGNAGMYFFTNRAQLTGTSPTDNWSYPGDFSQTIPDVYEQYRLVSACIEVKYIGQLDSAKGVIGGGISYLKTNNVGIRVAHDEYGGEWGSRNPDYAPFGNFENIRDCYYSTENNCLEGLRMLYFPLDNSFSEFKKVFSNSNQIDKVANYFMTDDGKNQYSVKVKDSCFRSGFNWLVYLLNGVSADDGGAYRLDYYFNYECIPKSEFLNYMPITLDYIPLSLEMKQKFLEEVRDKSVSKLNNK